MRPWTIQRIMGKQAGMQQGREGILIACPASIAEGETNKSMTSPLYCPLHRYRLSGETHRGVEQSPLEDNTKAFCKHKGEARHTVFIKDRGAYEQLGEIEIAFY